MTVEAFFFISFVTALLIILGAFYIHKKFTRNGKFSTPPIYKGWLPWLGCAIEFGKAPLYFIAQQQKKHGQVFTLFLAGERLTFLMDPADFHYFFQSSKVDFQKAVQSPVQKVASVTEASFFTCHSKIHDMVKGKLALTKLSGLFPQLQESFAKRLDLTKSQEKCDLLSLLREIMYAAVIDNLFGKEVLPTSNKKEFKELEEKFVIFDDQFEYGSKLPALFLKEWSNSKSWLLALFSRIIPTLKVSSLEEERTVLQSLIATVDAQHAPNYSLLLLWASLANAVPITFWTLAFVLADAQVLHTARDEVNSITGSSKEMSEEQLSKMQYLKWCVLEAIRLRSPGIVTRRVVESFTVKGYVIPANDLLMVSPFWAHRNPVYFPDPDAFQPERWRSADLEKNLYLDGFIAFGGGRYQCPGRWFALMEIQLFLAMFLQCFECQLLNSVPDLSPLHLVGTQQPVNSCLVHIRSL